MSDVGSVRQSRGFVFVFVIVFGGSRTIKNKNRYVMEQKSGKKELQNLSISSYNKTSNLSISSYNRISYSASLSYNRTLTHIEIVTALWRSRSRSQTNLSISSYNKTSNFESILARQGPTLSTLLQKTKLKLKIKSCRRYLFVDIGNAASRPITIIIINTTSQSSFLLNKHNFSYSYQILFTLIVDRPSCMICIKNQLLSKSFYYDGTYQKLIATRPVIHSLFRFLYYIETASAYCEILCFLCHFDEIGRCHFDEIDRENCFTEKPFVFVFAAKWL